MINFVPLIRADRRREINAYKSKGYIFRGTELSYCFTRNITVSNLSIYSKGKDTPIERQYHFQVRQINEPKFYVLVDSDDQYQCCLYLSIYEIYEILLQFANKMTPLTVVEYLMSDRSQKWYFQYTSLEFEINFYSEAPNSEIQLVPGSNVTLSYENLLILIIMIQEKSNYLWGISKEEGKEKYTDGIIRLLCCLISTSGNEILEKHGWMFLTNEGKYHLNLEKTYPLKKSYLTQQEYKNIMEVRNPSVRQ